MTTNPTPSIAQAAGEPDLTPTLWEVIAKNRGLREGEIWKFDTIGLSLFINDIALRFAAPTPSASSVPVAFPYQKTFNAIAAATSVCGGQIAVSVAKFVEVFDAAPPVNTATSVLTDEHNPVVLTNEELNALTKERFGNMHSMYAEGFRRLMRSAIESNAEKARALLQANGSTK